MVIDFHTHVFPEKIAAGTISHLSLASGNKPNADGTVSGLCEKMREAGVDVAVNLPVLTSPRQFDSVNRFARELNEREWDGARIISFAGIHPDCEGIREKMRYIKDAGFLGIKIHPDYQSTFINDRAYLEICDAAAEESLIVVTHAGVDAGFRDEPVRCTPKLALDLIRRVPYEKIVFAHLGGNEMPREVLEQLAGERVYIDTAYVMKSTSHEDFTSIIAKHGCDRVLFGSDSPWSNIKDDIDIIKSHALEKSEEADILGGNAKRLLGI